MSFHPSMTAFTQGIHLRAPLHFRAWGEVIADLWQVSAACGGGGHYLSPHPRLVIFLGAMPALDLCDRMQGNTTLWRPALPMLFVPAGLPLWSRINAASQFAHLDLHFSAAALQRLTEGLSWPGSHDQPLACAASGRIGVLANLLAEECRNPDAHGSDGYADGLTRALLAEFLAQAADDACQTAPATTFSGPQAEVSPHRGGLTPGQQRRLADHARANLHRRLTVAELAVVCGLSESWFAHAFRHSFAQTPHRWLTGLRIDCAKALLAAPDMPLSLVADTTGFADQAHLTRAFRSWTGTTPAAFRREAEVKAEVEAGNGTGVAADFQRI